MIGDLCAEVLDMLDGLGQEARARALRLYAEAEWHEWSPPWREAARPTERLDAARCRLWAASYDERADMLLGRDDGPLVLPDIAGLLVRPEARP